MELLLVSDVFADRYTRGRLFVSDGIGTSRPRFECYTLEDAYRPGQPKVPGETCIPAGRYEVVPYPSPHFGREMPLLVDVPNFENIEIHPGNSDKDTRGCILVGQTTTNDDWIGASRAAFDALWPRLKAAFDAGEQVWITVQRD